MVRARRRQRGANQPERGRKKPVILPPELLTIILEQALIVPGGIELCPDPFYWDEKKHAHKPFCKYKSDAFNRAYQHQSDKLNQSLSPHLGLLTVSRDFSYEALRILYGKNDFRFTNSAGWFGLDIFLEQIGRHNEKRLRSVTVGHPYWSYLPTSLRERDEYVRGTSDRLKMHSKPKRLHYTTRWFDAHKIHRHIYSPFKQLDKFGVLRRLRIVFPGWAKEKDLDEIIHTMFVDKSKFKKLELTVVRLMKPEYLSRPGEKTLSAKEIAERLEEVDCSWEEVELDENGNYEVLDSSASWQNREEGEGGEGGEGDEALE